MKKTILFFLLCAFFAGQINAQKYFTRSGEIIFYSDAPMEKIKAENASATSVLDTETGKMEFAVLIKGFLFTNALMQDHFNENYMESSKYPKAIFKGEIQNLDEIDFNSDGEYTAKVKGQLTVHGVSQEKEVEGLYTVKDGTIKAVSKFDVSVAAHNIDVPAVVKDNIAKSVEVTVYINYEPFKRN